MNEDEIEALRLIREIHATGGRRLTREEELEVCTAVPNLGPPRFLRSGTRGPKSKRTQYDQAKARRKGPYHRLKRLPEAGALGRKRVGLRLLARVDAVARECPVPTAKKVWLRLKKDGFHHDLGTIRRALQTLGHLRRKTPRD